MPHQSNSGTPPALQGLSHDRVSTAAVRYQGALARQPGLARELQAGGLVRSLSHGQAWAFREWTERAVEASVLSRNEADTVHAALERSDWHPDADLAMRCAVVQLMAELLGAGGAS